ADRVLSAEAAGRRLNFEEGPRVVVEPADEPRFGTVGDAQQIQLTTELVPMSSVIGLEQVEDCGSGPDELLIAGILRIEDAERVVCEAISRSFAELCFTRPQMLAQDVTVS